MSSTQLSGMIESTSSQMMFSSFPRRKSINISGEPFSVEMVCFVVYLKSNLALGVLVWKFIVVIPEI